MRCSVLLGSTDANSGIGKSSLARALACQLAQAIVKACGLPANKARVYEVQTVDVLRECPPEIGSVLLFDEFCPDDPEQVIYLSENAFKALCLPTAPATIRARNTDIFISPNIPRIFTANRTSGPLWVGKRIAWSGPLERRVIVFPIEKPLVSPEWVASLTADVSNHLAIADELSNSAPPAPAPIPVPGIPPPPNMACAMILALVNWMRR